MANEIKKSLLVTLAFPPNNVGGVATFYYNVCKNLPPDKIVVLAPQHPDADEFDSHQRFTIIRKKLLNQFPQTMPRGLGGVLKIAATVRWLSLIKHFKQIIKTHRIQLIQVGQVLPIGTLALMSKKRQRIPYIFYAHGLDILLPQKFMRKKTLLKKIIGEANAIVANSYFTKDKLLYLGADAKKITVVHPGPNLENQDVSQLKLKKIIATHRLQNRKVLLTVGRLVKRKGHDMVLRALPQIIKQVPNVVYLIIGDGPDRQELVKLTNQLRLGDRVKFLGQVASWDLPAYYQACHVFIMPSRQINTWDVEGFGIVYLEANLFGKPVIGGKSGGIAEAVVDGQTGLLVSPTDQDQIAKAAVRLLTDTAYAERLGLQGLERTTSQFDWEGQTAKIKELLR